MTAAILDDWLAQCSARIDAHLEKVLPQASEPPQRLHQAMRAAVFSPGKRLRPALAFAAAEACGREPEAVLPVAAAAELVHAYSLVHDDLPAMDDDAERRGQPTVHVAFGEAEAILAGDALLALGFAQLAQPGDAGRGGGPTRARRRLAPAGRRAGRRSGRQRAPRSRASSSTLDSPAQDGGAVRLRDLGRGPPVRPADPECGWRTWSATPSHYGLAFQARRRPARRRR